MRTEYRTRKTKKITKNNSFKKPTRMSESQYYKQAVHWHGKAVEAEVDLGRASSAYKKAERERKQYRDAYQHEVKTNQEFSDWLREAEKEGATMVPGMPTRLLTNLMNAQRNMGAADQRLASQVNHLKELEDYKSSVLHYQVELVEGSKPKPSGSKDQSKEVGALKQEVNMLKAENARQTAARKDMARRLEAMQATLDRVKSAANRQSELRERMQAKAQSARDEADRLKIELKTLREELSGREPQKRAEGMKRRRLVVSDDSGSSGGGAHPGGTHKGGPGMATHGSDQPRAEDEGPSTRVDAPGDVVAPEETKAAGDPLEPGQDDEMVISLEAHSVGMSQGDSEVSESDGDSSVGGGEESSVNDGEDTSDEDIILNPGVDQPEAFLPNAEVGRPQSYTCMGCGHSKQTDATHYVKLCSEHRVCFNHLKVVCQFDYMLRRLNRDGVAPTSQEIVDANIEGGIPDRCPQCYNKERKTGYNARTWSVAMKRYERRGV